MKQEITEGERIFLEKIRALKEELIFEYTPEDKLSVLKHRVEEIKRYIIYEILR